MLGDVVLDKLKLIYQKSEVSPENRELARERLKELFPTAQVWSKTGYIHNLFNPAKLVDSDRKTNYDHNLQMVSESQLAKAFREVFPDEIKEYTWNTVIHTAKNIILRNPIQDYMEMLYNLSIPYASIEAVEGDISTSLYLQYDTKDETKGTHHFRIKFYDKGKEYCKRHKSPICRLYEPLTDSEIDLLGDTYDPKTHSVDMSRVNMLRIEIELVQKSKLTPIIEKLDNSGGCLTLPVIIKALEQGKFYKVLEEVFNEKLRKYVFTARGTFEEIAEEMNLSTYRKNAYLLQFQNTNVKYFNWLMRELGCEDEVAEMNRFIRKVVPDSELYMELYSQLFPQNNTEITEEMAGAFTAETPNRTDTISTVGIIKRRNNTCLDLYDSSLKRFILVYEVPILDDS